MTLCIESFYIPFNSYSPFITLPSLMTISFVLIDVFNLVSEILFVLLDVFNFPRHLAWLHNEEFLWLLGTKLQIVCNYLNNFGCCRQCGSKNITYLTFKMVLQDHLCDFMKGSYSFFVLNLPNLVTIGIVAVDKKVCDVLPQDHLVIRSWSFMGRTQLR